MLLVCTSEKKCYIDTGYWNKESASPKNKNFMDTAASLCIWFNTVVLRVNSLLCVWKGSIQKNQNLKIN